MLSLAHYFFLLGVILASTKRKRKGQKVRIRSFSERLDDSLARLSFCVPSKRPVAQKMGLNHALQPFADFLDVFP